MTPLAIDLFCGLGGWTDGLLAENYYVVGFDIERHDYGDGAKYPAQLVLQDVTTIHGRQFKDAALIVASPPCQEFSYMAMPWSLAKEKQSRIEADAAEQKRLTALFDACFRIQREASAAAGHWVPMVVENVRGAQKWVGRSRWNYGSYHLWGDVPALMPMTRKAFKVPGFRFDGSGGSFQTASVESMKQKCLRDERHDNNQQGPCSAGFCTWPHCLESIEETGFKSQGMNWSDRSIKGQDFTRIAAAQKTSGLVQKRNGHGHTRHLTNQAEHDAIKNGGDWFNASEPSAQRQHGSKSKARKAASAAIAKIPFTLARYIAAHFKPQRSAA